MANVDHIKVGSTSYDISPSPTGTLTTGTGGFSSSDVAQASATSWTSVDQITTSDNHASIFTKITQMAKNVRYLYNVLGTGFSTGSTVKNQIDGKAAANHSHKVAQLPTSSTQVNSNDYIPTSALIYSINQTLTSLNDASNKSSLGKDIITLYDIGGVPDGSSFSSDTSIQSIIIKILGDASNLDHDTTPPNTRYEVKNLGTWSRYSDVDSFLDKCKHATGYYGASIGSTITIKDGTYNKDWVIVGFDMEHNRSAADGTPYDNGYGIFMIPTTSLFNPGSEWMGFNNGYMHTHVHDQINNILSSFSTSNSILGNHLINRRMLLSNYTNYWSSPLQTHGYEWTTGYGALMSAGQITGTFASNTNIYDDGEANYKLPYFNFKTWQFGDYTYLRGLGGSASYNNHSNYYDKPWHVSNGSVLGHDIASYQTEINGKKPGIFPLIMIR